MKVILLLLSLYLSLPLAFQVECLPIFHLGSDPDDIKKDHIDIKDAYYTINDTHITFYITCYGEIKTQKKHPTLPDNEFQVCLNLKIGQGDDRRKVLFEGADIIVTAYNQKVYYWDGKWKENTTVSVNVVVNGDQITIGCRLSDIQYEQASGDIYIGFISNLNKVGSKGVNKGIDQAPDSGWYTFEGGVPDLNFLESSIAGILGFVLAYVTFKLKVGKKL